MSNHATHSKSGLNVLVIEDDASVRETLGMVLEAYQYNPILVDSGANALKWLESNWPDVMLLDLTLQEMNGEEVYREISKRFNKVPPTIVLSAVQHGEVRASLLPGAWFLAKPYTIEALVNMIGEASQARGAA